MKTRYEVIIIGGGITGLATAWWLHKASVDVLVLESDRTVGGTMRSIREGGWLIETGPNSALDTTPLFRSLFDDLGLSDEVVYADEAANNRYILRDGELHALPMTPSAFFKSNLWSAAGKLRLLREPLIGRSAKEETIAEFVERRLGREFLDYAINPFVAGVYAGNPEQLSVRAAFPKLYALEEQYGGLIRGQILGRRARQKRAEQSKDRAHMFSFKSGMAAFPEALGRLLSSRILTGAAVQKITEHSDPAFARYDVTGTKDGEGFKSEADVVLTAIPSYATAGLVASYDRTLSDSLAAIYYPPVVEVFLGFRSSDVKRALGGFGFLVPSKEQRSILGTIWSSSLFPGRAPENHVALTTFVGGSRQPELTERNDDQLIRGVLQELTGIMRLEGQPVFTHIARWQQAIPQYNLGHLSVMAHIERFEQQHPGMFLSGNFRGGISVGDCVISSARVSHQVQEFLKNHRTLD